MRRLFLGFCAILFLFSCNQHLVVREVNTKNISIDSQSGPLDSIVESMVKPYRDSIEHDMSSLVAVSSSFLAPQTKYTDLIVGGHSHTFLEKPLALKNADGKPVFINQAGWAALATGKIEFIFDRTGKRKPFMAVVNNL
jgi:hypothetical protein